jgi:hypothetical protein
MDIQSTVETNRNARVERGFCDARARATARCRWRGASVRLGALACFLRKTLEIVYVCDCRMNRFFHERCEVRTGPATGRAPFLALPGANR